MRKVGVDGGAANGSTGGTKRSAPGHGPTKNRFASAIFCLFGWPKPFPAGCSLDHQKVRRLEERRVLMVSTMTSLMRIFTHSSCTLVQLLKSDNTGENQIGFSVLKMTFIFRWEDSGRKKGFGYIEFQEEEAADAACGVHKVRDFQNCSPAACYMSTWDEVMF